MSNARLSGSSGDRPFPKVILWPLLGFVAVLLLTVALAATNSAIGSSLVLAPGESLGLVGACLIAAYAVAIDRLCVRLPGGDDRRSRWVMVALSTALSAPVIGLLVTPALNGLGSWGPTLSHEVIVSQIETTSISKSNRLRYWARIVPQAMGANAPPAGRYPLGTYSKGWQPPEGIEASRFSRVRVTHRVGLLGAITVMEALPIQGP